MNKSRKPLYNIRAKAWEHPADRAALSALEQIPGLDQVLQKVIGATTERSLRLLALSSSVRVTGSQFSRVHTAYREACHVLDVKEIPDLFVSQNPFFNAGAIGVNRPFIILNSSVAESLSHDELMAICAHELGHCLSGHMLYKTLLELLLKISASAIAQIPFGGIALTGIILALQEWDRKSELSADRASLLAVQDPEACYHLLMKMAGGNSIAQMDINEFCAQAAEYEAGGSYIDGLYKLLNLLGRSHPFPVLRLTALKTWVDSGAYGKIIDGDYRQGEQPRGDVKENFEEAAKSYRDDMKSSKDPLTKTVSDIVENVSSKAGTAKDIFESIWNSRKAD